MFFILIVFNFFMCVQIAHAIIGQQTLHDIPLHLEDGIPEDTIKHVMSYRLDYLISKFNQMNWRFREEKALHFEGKLPAYYIDIIEKLYRDFREVEKKNANNKYYMDFFLMNRQRKLENEFRMALKQIFVFYNDWLRIKQGRKK